MTTGVRDKYSVAINSRGYIIKGTPSAPSYVRQTATSQIDRLAISDLDYADFSGTGLFFIAQTDWSGGIKDEKLWRDDAKYLMSTNIDIYSERGVIKLCKELVAINDFDKEIRCGTVATIGVGTYEFVGYGERDTYSRVRVYKKDGTWTDIAEDSFTNTTGMSINQLLGHKSELIVLCRSGATTGVSTIVMQYDGSAWTDHSAAIAAVSTAKVTGAPCGLEVGTSLYVFITDNSATKAVSLVCTSDNGANWTEEFTAQTSFFPISCCYFGGLIYYLSYRDPIMMLRCYDLASNVDTEVATFDNVSISYGTADKYLKVHRGKLIITVPKNTAGTVGEIYEYDGTSLARIWRSDDDKVSSGYLYAPSILKGCVEEDNNLFWSNLVYDGESFFNHKRPLGDASNKYLFPLYRGISAMVYSDDSDNTIIYSDTTTFKTTLANNYIIFSEMAPISSIDKLLHSVTIIFDTMAANQAIKVEYSIDNRATWTEVGTQSYVANGPTKKEWLVPGNIIFNKIFFRVSLDGSATTPKVRDFIMAYKPMPEHKNRWVMRLDMSDKFKLLNGQDEERSGLDLMSEIWNYKLLKQKVIYEDIDYVECRLLASITATATSASISNISHLPRKGRIRAVSGGVAEEMVYTSAQAGKLLGITRGYRGTQARAYPSGQVIKNDYDVYIEDVRSEANFLDENKIEAVAQVTLIEA